jgi:hypothetical protein
MTVIGKILTFFIFFFSLVFLGFAVTINQINKDPQTGQSWFTAAQKLSSQLKAAQADARAKDEENASLRAEIANLNKALATAKANAERDLKDKDDQLTAATNRYKSAEAKFAQVQIALDEAVAELQKRREEATRLYEIIKTKDSQIADLTTERTNALNLRTQAEVAANTFRERAMQLEQTVQEQAREIQDLLTRGLERQVQRGPAAAPIQPPADVQGVVKQVDGNAGLVLISIGSDAGLMRGHTLQLYRLNPAPLYLGQITVIEVSPHEAIAKLLDPKAKKQVQKDDIVASRIISAMPQK